MLTLGLGAAASSLALVGFGTVSVVEVFASAVVVWHLAPSHESDRHDRTRLALRLIGGAFLIVGIALAIAAISDLATGRRADASPFGIAYLAIAATVMFSLAFAKRRTASALGSAPLHSEATVTLLDGVLSTTTLVGLALNALFGWWWADPAAALIVALAAFNEARETWSEAFEWD